MTSFRSFIFYIQSYVQRQNVTEIIQKLSKKS